MAEKNKQKKPTRKSGLGFIRICIIIIALGVFAFAAYNLYQIFNDYRKSDQEYDRLRDKYTSPGAAPAPVDDAPDLLAKYEDAEPPLTPNWDELRKINKDVVGWIFVEGEPTISYPIVWREEDDDYYLHRSFEGQYLYAGTLFLEGLNNPDFSDPLSIVYGHNMKNGSMFAKLSHFLDQSVYDKNPYFWILTPNGDYRYHIFSVLQTEPDSYAYALFSESGGEFLEYEKEMQKASVVKNNVPLYDDDKCVLLSTCVSDHIHRTVVLGRCCSTNQPQNTTGKPPAYTSGDGAVQLPTPTPTPVPTKKPSSLDEVVGNLFGLG